MYVDIFYSTRSVWQLWLLVYFQTAFFHTIPAQRKSFRTWKLLQQLVYNVKIMLQVVVFSYRTGIFFLYMAPDLLTAWQWWRQSAQQSTGRPGCSSSDSSQGPSARTTHVPKHKKPDNPISQPLTPLPWGLWCSKVQFISRRRLAMWPWDQRAMCQRPVRRRLWWR